MPTELPASALYSSPALGRLWKKVHLACSPFLQRPVVRRLYEQPSAVLRKKLKRPYRFIALGCADGTKEGLLLKKLPQPDFLLAADTNLSLARQAARRLPGKKKAFRKIDLSSVSAFRFSNSAFSSPPSTSSATGNLLLVTLFGVLPNLDPLPLLQRVSRAMKAGDLLLFSANLAPGRSGFSGAHKVLPQYDNHPTRRWLLAAVKGCRPKLPMGRLQFGVRPDPRQKSLARIEARWISPKKDFIIFSSRRPTVRQVETWIRLTRLKKIDRFLDPRGEEGVWLVAR